MLPSCLSLFLNLPAHKRTVTCKCPDVVLSSLLLATTVCRLLGGQTKTASAICSPTNICYSKFNIVVNHIFDLYFCCMHLLVNKLFVFVGKNCRNFATTATARSRGFLTGSGFTPLTLCVCGQDGAGGRIWRSVPAGQQPGAGAGLLRYHRLHRLLQLCRHQRHQGALRHHQVGK